ncbi:hypothetical protein ACWCQL_01485 [Streptomyces sp. NPDC002073]
MASIAQHLFGGEEPEWLPWVVGALGVGYLGGIFTTDRGKAAEALEALAMNAGDAFVQWGVSVLLLAVVAWWAKRRRRS